SSSRLATAAATCRASALLTGRRGGGRSAARSRLRASNRRTPRGAWPPPPPARAGTTPAAERSQLVLFLWGPAALPSQGAQPVPFLLGQRLGLAVGAVAPRPLGHPLVPSTLSRHVRRADA